MPETLFDAVDDVAARQPERVALAHAGRTVRYGEMVATARRLAYSLRAAHGVNPGDRVALVAEGGPEWVFASLAIQAAGAVEVARRPPGPPVGSDDIEGKKLASFLRRAECRHCFVPDAETIRRLRRARLPDDIALITLNGSAAPQATSLRSLVAEACTDTSESRAAAGASATHTAAIISTSGTTGPAKMGRITHGNLLHFVSRFPSLVDIGPNDVCLVSLPLWHLYGRLAVYTTLSVGARASFAPLSELPEALKTVRPTVFPTFPVVWESLYHQLIEIARARPVRARLLHAAMLLSRHRLGLRRVAGKREIRLAPEHAVAAAARQAGALVLGAMLAPAHWLAGRTVYRQALRMLGGRMRLTILGDAAVPEYVEDVLQAMGIGVVQGYGSTEQIVSILRQSGNHPAGTLGDVFPGTRLRLLKDDGAPAAPAEPAEIAVSGPQVFAGYWRNEALDRRCLRRLEDGRWWYFTGDLAMRDHHDNLVFVGRRDNTFRHPTSGNPVHPERCESMLRESVYIRGAMLFPEMGSMTVLIVPDPRELFRWHALNAGAVTSEFARLPVDPFAVLAFVDSHPREMRELVRDPRTVALYRDRIKRLTRNRLLRTDEVPERFCIAESALMPGRELTHTLKLRREPVRTTILPGLPRHRI